MPIRVDVFRYSHNHHLTFGPSHIWVAANRLFLDVQTDRSKRSQGCEARQKGRAPVQVYEEININTVGREQRPFDLTGVL